MAAQLLFDSGSILKKNVADWPAPFDVEADILQPGKRQTFVRQLKAACNTHGLLQVIEEVPPTKAGIG